MGTQELVTFCEPMLATLVRQLPAGSEWQYEVKWDGYRVQVIKDGKSARLFSRRGNDFTKRFAPIARAAETLNTDVAVLDGELVAIDEKGRPSFQALQGAGNAGAYHVVFYAFDLLNHNGADLRRQPLVERQAALAKIVSGSVIRFAAPLEGTAQVVMQAVRQHGLEGIVAKRKDSIYESGARSNAWQKLPLKPKDEFYIGAYRLDGTRLEILLVGHFEGGKFLFAGKVHQGLNPMNRRALLKLLEPLRVSECPFANLPTSKSGHWGEGVTAEEMGDY
jgi:bifunctional non-homologous end joining protein LigD